MNGVLDLATNNTATVNVTGGLALNGTIIVGQRRRQHLRQRGFSGGIRGQNYLINRAELIPSQIVVISSIRAVYPASGPMSCTAPQPPAAQPHDPDGLAPVHGWAAPPKPMSRSASSLRVQGNSDSTPEKCPCNN